MPPAPAQPLWRFRRHCDIWVRVITSYSIHYTKLYEKVFQFGDAIAIVCADTEKNAKAAAAKVKVDLEPLPEYMNAPAAMAEDAIEIHPGTPNVYYIQNLKKGAETAPIFDGADVIAEDDFYVSRQPHMPIEPDVGFAYPGEDGTLTIHSKSIGIHLHLAMIAPGIGIEPEKLTLVQNPTGGTFGYKFSRITSYNVCYTKLLRQG